MTEGASFGELFVRYRERVWRAAYSVTLDATEADDATQEAFMKALRAWDREATGSESGARFEGRSDPGTWLYRIAINAARDRLRRRASERARLARAAEVQADVTRPSASLATNPAEIAERRDEEAALQSALGELRPDHREAFCLRELAGLSVRDAATALGCSEAKLRVDLHRARRELRRILMPKGTQ